ncbi:hypothetical protein BCR34DRAFT_246693 [Clohesyomyces aquaticus]|uniref:Uncharacterized protein n=1 Tax=Clohesyomyces aquaticus TaxID=1231657 RepID=A0A1Y1ZV22_9PLEO|nr:hypothetical protein BCR34DRAFT_246693 [Clohesyomyces aquaticus]
MHTPGWLCPNHPLLLACSQSRRKGKLLVFLIMQCDIGADLPAGFTHYPGPGTLSLKSLCSAASSVNEFNPTTWFIDDAAKFCGCSGIQQRPVGLVAGLSTFQIRFISAHQCESVLCLASGFRKCEPFFWLKSQFVPNECEPNTSRQMSMALRNTKPQIVTACVVFVGDAPLLRTISHFIALFVRAQVRLHLRQRTCCL